MSHWNAARLTREAWAQKYDNDTTRPLALSAVEISETLATKAPGMPLRLRALVESGQASFTDVDGSRIALKGGAAQHFRGSSKPANETEEAREKREAAERLAAVPSFDKAEWYREHAAQGGAAPQKPTNPGAKFAASVNATATGSTDAVRRMFK